MGHAEGVASYVAATLTHELSWIARSAAGVASTLLTCAMFVSYAYGDGAWRPMFVASIACIAVVQLLVLVRWCRGGWPFARALAPKFVWCLLLLLLGAFAHPNDHLGLVDGACLFSWHAVFHVAAAWAVYLTMALSAHLRMPETRLRPQCAALPFALYTVEPRAPAPGAPEVVQGIQVAAVDASGRAEPSRGLYMGAAVP